MAENNLEIFEKINTFIFDVDGVLTDGSVTLIGGDMVRSMNIKDGYALQLAVKKGYHVCIISGGKSESVRTRLNNLGIKEVYIGVSDKIEKFEDFLMCYDIKPETVAYMGDDMPDYEVMTKVAMPSCPADACSEIQEISAFISTKNGGKGAGRDLIEKVLKVQGNWE